MSDHVTRKGLCEQRADIGAQMTELVKNQDPTEGLSNDEHAKFKQMETDFDRLSERIKEFDAVEERLKALESVRETTARTEYVANERTAPTNRITERDKELALRGWMRRDSPTEPTAKEDEAMKKVGIRENSKMLAANLLQRAPRSASEVAEAYAEAAELRATSDFQNTSTGADGGNTVPNEMMANVEIFMVAYSGVRRAGAEIFRTATGGTLPIPIMDDTATTALGAIIAQNTASTQHGVPFAQVTLSPKTYTSRHIGVSWELMQDTSVNLAALLGEAIGTRIGRIQNVHFTIGVSSDGQPIGFLEASTNSSNASAVGVTSSTYNELIYNEVVSLLHSVDQAYRSDPSCGWQFTDTTLALFRRLSDTTGRPLWTPSLVGPEADAVLGYPYTINPDVYNFQSTSGSYKALAFGKWRTYKIQEPLGIEVRRLDERFADQRASAFFGWARADGAPTNANAIKHLITGSSS